MKSICLNYKSKYALESRKSTFNKCVINKFINKFHLLPFGYRIDQRSNLLFNNKSLEYQLKLIEDICDNILHPIDCHQN